MHSSCPKCNNQLTIVGNIIVCGICGYTKFANQKPWYTQLAEEDELWNKKFIQEAPSIVAYEFAILRKYLHNGSVYALPMKIKDNFEALIKFFVIIKLSKAMSNKAFQQKHAKILHKFLTKTLSMGDWVSIANEIIESTDKTITIKDTILKNLSNICKICQENKIVNWRNNTIGHGALTPAETLDFEQDIKAKIQLLAEHYNNYADEYARIHINLNLDDNTIRLAGIAMIKNLLYHDGKLSYHIDNTSGNLSPLIIFYNNSIYFFDSIQRNRNGYQYLDYITGKKINLREPDLKKLTKKIERHIGTRAIDTNVEETIYPKCILDIMENFSMPTYPISFDFLKSWLNQFINNNSNGLCMLCMEEGMGKTTFVRMANQYRGKNDKNRIINFDYTLCRTFYINPTYAQSPATFVQQLTQALSLTDNNEILTGQFPTVNIESPIAKQQLANLLNEFHKYYLNHYNKKNMIIFIDGIDEITYSKNTSIMDILPSTEMLENGIYIVLTCRTTNEISAYKKKILENHSEIETIEVNSHNKEYRKAMIESISKYTDNESAKYIVDLAKNKVMNTGILIESYRIYGKDKLLQIKSFTAKTKFILLQDLYGEEYFSEIQYLATILSILPIGLPIKHIAYLIGDSTISFKLFSYLDQLRDFINIYYTENEMILSITREDVKNYLLSNKLLLKEIKDEMILNLQSLDYSKDNINDLDTSCSLAQLLIVINDDNSKLDTSVISNLLEMFSDHLNHSFCDNDVFLHKYDYLMYELLCKRIGVLINKYPQAVSQNFNLFKEISNLLHQQSKVPTAITFLDTIYENAKSGVLTISDNEKVLLLEKLSAFCYEINSIEKYNYYNKESVLFQKVVIDNKKLSVKDFLNYCEGQLQKAITQKNNNNNIDALRTLDKIEEYLRIFAKISGVTETNTYQSIAFLLYKTFANVYKRATPHVALRYMNKAQVALDLVQNTSISVGALSLIHDFYLNKGQIHKALKQYDDAIICYNKGLENIQKLKISGKSYEVAYEFNFYKSIANVEYERKNFSKAIEYYTLSNELFERLQNNGHTISIEPYAGNLFTLGKIYDELKNKSKSQEYYDKYALLTSLINPSKEAQIVGESNLSKFIQEKIDLLINIGHPEIAEQFCNQYSISNTEKQNKPYIEKNDKKSMYIIDKLINNNHISEAIRYLNIYIAENPTFWAYNNRAYCFFEKKDYKRALADDLSALAITIGTENNLSTANLKTVHNIITILIRHLALYCKRIEDYHCYEPMFLESARNLILSHSILGKIEETYIPLDDNNFMICDKQFFEENIIDSLQKYSTNNNIELGAQFAYEAMKQLYLPITPQENIDKIFTKLIPDANKSIYNCLVNFFSPSLIAIALLTKAAQYSFHPALRYLAFLYDNGKFIPNSPMLSQNLLLLFKQNSKNLKISDAASSAKIEELDLSLTNAINELKIKHIETHFSIHSN